MTTLAQVALLLTLLAEPLLALAVDIRSHLRARRPTAGRAGAAEHPRGGPGGARPVTDLTVVVPVQDAHDLDRLGSLHDEGARVLLVADAGHPPAFHRRLWAVADAHGFRVHVVGARRRTDPGGPPPARAGRQRLLRDAHVVLTGEYVVCVDPGAVAARPWADVVGELARTGADVGTLTTATPPHGAPARLRRVEDALAARVRHHVPWLVRGGAHVARRTVHADLVRRQDDFGPGDDLALGIVAAARGHRVTHLDVPVHVAAPAARAWWRARVLEAAGAFRVGVVHLHLGLRRPSLHLLELAAAFALVPGLWWSALHVPWALVAVVVAHGALTALATRDLRDPVAWVYPLYAVLRAFVVLPLGVLVHVATAARAGDAGALRVRDRWWSDDAAAPVVRRLPGPGPARATDWWAAR